MDDMPFTKEELSTFSAYTATLPFAMDCMGHNGESWLRLLWERSFEQRAGSVWRWEHFLKIREDININLLIYWADTEEGHEFWQMVATIAGLGGFNREGGFQL